MSTGSSSLNCITPYTCSVYRRYSYTLITSVVATFPIPIYDFESPLSCFEVDGPVAGLWFLASKGLKSDSIVLLNSVTGSYTCTSRFLTIGFAGLERREEFAFAADWVKNTARFLSLTSSCLRAAISCSFFAISAYRSAIWYDMDELGAVSSFARLSYLFGEGCRLTLAERVLEVRFIDFFSPL